jgi:hypothetical protein
MQPGKNQTQPLIFLVYGSQVRQQTRIDSFFLDAGFNEFKLVDGQDQAFGLDHLRIEFV